MVKTLNFHFNNVGSIPAGLISVFCAYATKKNKLCLTTYVLITFSTL
jgi:hypothetical protein